MSETIQRRTINTTISSQRYKSLMDKAIHFVGIAAGADEAMRSAHQAELGTYVRRVARESIAADLKKFPLMVDHAMFGADRTITIYFTITETAIGKRTKKTTIIKHPFCLELRMGGGRASAAESDIE